MLAAGHDTKPPKRKIVLLPRVARKQAIEVYDTFSFTAEEEGKYESVIEEFTACCNPKKNETYECYVFHRCKQLQGEPVEQFVADLKLKAQTCQFDNLRDSMIRDRLVLGVSSQRVRECLLRQEDLDLDKAVKICQAAEATEKQILTLAQKGVSSSDTSVNYCNTRGRRQQQRKPFQPSTKQKPATKCSCCGTTHAPRACPAHGKACNKCSCCDTTHAPRACPAHGKACNKCSCCDTTHAPRACPAHGKACNNFKCSCCDTTHAPRACPAHDKACNKCGKSGHFARVCRSKPKDGKVRYVSHYDSTDRYVSHYDPTDRYVSHYDPTDRYVSHYDPTDRYVSHYDPTDRYVSHYDPTDRYVSHYDPTDGMAEMFVDMVKMRTGDRQQMDSEAVC